MGVAALTPQDVDVGEGLGEGGELAQGRLGLAVARRDAEVHLEWMVAVRALAEHRVVVRVVPGDPPRRAREQRAVQQLAVVVARVLG